MRTPSLPDLPIKEALPALHEALIARGAVLLDAPPGAGKSTIVPIALLDGPWLAGRKILMLEPRRIAARAVAMRMAALLGEPVGRTVGFRTRLETRVGRETRIEVVTEGILTRMLQEDSALAGVGCVIFDEFHERSLNADLGLALCIESRENLRRRPAAAGDVGDARFATSGAAARRRADRIGAGTQLRSHDPLCAAAQ